MTNMLRGLLRLMVLSKARWSSPGLMVVLAITIVSISPSLGQGRRHDGSGGSVGHVLPGCLTLLQGGPLDYKAGICAGLIAGVFDHSSSDIDVLSDTNTPLATRQRWATDFFCAPATLMPLDEVRAVVSYIADQRRQSSGRSTGRLFTGEAYFALRAAWPCAQPNR
jgi:hypothetical protein